MVALGLALARQQLDREAYQATEAQFARFTCLLKRKYTRSAMGEVTVARW